MQRDDKDKCSDAPSERRRTTLNCRLTPTEARGLKEIAARRGETVTETILRATVYAGESAGSYADEVRGELKDVEAVLSGILVTLGQIRDASRTIETDRRSIVAREAVAALKGLADENLADEVSAAAVRAAEAVGRTTLRRR